MARAKHRIVSADRAIDQADRRLLAATSAGGGFYLYDIASSDRCNLLDWRPQRNQRTRSSTRSRPNGSPPATGPESQAIVTYPRHRTGKNLPVVDDAHGGPFGAHFGDQTGLEPWNQPLAEAGLCGDPAELSRFGRLWPGIRQAGPRARRVRQADAGRSDRRGQPPMPAKVVVDPKRACMMGWSYGGYASARGAQRDPALWRCAIAGRRGL